MATKEKKYKTVNGTSYRDTTPDKVIEWLEHSRKTGERIVLDYGDTETGRSWGEVHDIIGRVSRSNGSIKVPILVYNARSMGGGAVLDDCIIKITEAKGGRVLYKHPKVK